VQDLWRWRLFGVLWLFSCGAQLVLAADEPRTVPARSFGAVEGTVTYSADPKRPWRYARFYIKQSKTGELAEAVVALRARPVESAPRTPQTIVIDQKNFQFTPETVVIHRGDSVKFTNSDEATHNVFSKSDLSNFNVATPSRGDHTERFDRAGGVRKPITIGCVFHSAMHANIFVFDHPWYALTPTDGTYRLADVPPGQYELEMLHPSGALHWRQRVDIKAGERLRIDIRVSPDDTN